MKIRSSKGFSLVELMIVVAIIGILASIAVPTFNSFRAKSRQAEAKTLLSSLYTGQKAFFAEWSMYFGDFRDIGFTPEGQLRYRVTNGGGGPGLPLSYNFLGGACGAPPCTGTVGAQNDTAAFCAASALCDEDTAYVGAPAGAVAPTAVAFTAAAASNIDGDADLDMWTINEGKVLRNTQADINN